MPRPAVRAALLSLCLASVLPLASFAQDAAGKLAAPLEAQRRLITAKFSTMVPIATIGAGEGLLAELEKNIGPDVTAIVIESGSYTLSDILASASKKGLGRLIGKSGSSVTIAAPLVVWKGAELRIGAGEHVVLDRSRSALILNAGTLSVIDATIEGSAFADAQTPFRPFLLTVVDGEAVFKGSVIHNLGFGTFAETSGLSFLGRGYSLGSPNIEVSDNDISDLVSVSFIRSSNSTVTGNRLTGMRSSGIVLQSASNAKVKGNSLLSATGHGIRITSQSQKIDLQDNTIVNARSHGVFVDDGSVLVAMSRNRIERNGLSGIVLKKSGCNAVSNNTLANNALSGIRSEASFGITIVGNSIVENRDGITLEGQTSSVATEVHDNLFSRNLAGIRSDAHGDLNIARNDFSKQWTRLFAGAIASSTGRYLASQDAGRNSEFVLKGEAKTASVQLASFSAFGLADCTSKK